MCHDTRHHLPYSRARPLGSRSQLCDRRSRCRSAAVQGVKPYDRTDSFGGALVAIGNALPDLVTSVTATVKGASGLALGNIVGSCVINALLTIGLSSLVIPLRADSIGFVDFITLVGAAALLWIVPSSVKSKSIGRLFGIILALLYVAYMVFTVIRG
ncbi:MAG: hypothetical protein K2N48_05710 [Muribaculaceae bacterium]|nr:hypothetical protein [Muribaculaceae bacterium]